MELDTLVENLLPCDGQVYLQESFLSREESASYFDQLLNQVPWQQNSVVIFGQNRLEPRLTAWYADPDVSLTYSGKRMESTTWLPCLLNLRELVQNRCKVHFNGVLLNLYRDGNDSMGWHSDDEFYLGPQPLIASVSLGATRRFRLRHRQRDASPIGLDLTAGSLLVMQGQTQQFWHHAVPRTRRFVLPRINLTFRYVNI